MIALYIYPQTYSLNIDSNDIKKIVFCTRTCKI